MGGVYQEDFAASRLHASRFFMVARQDEDPEILREKARRIRALGLEPPRASHLRRYAKMQGLTAEAQTEVVVPVQRSPNGAQVAAGLSSLSLGSGSKEVSSDS
eukprot:CAMPEP_0181464404 /NCGR_PEP_ID=MMETSP1110-20121109/35417_1 /TAXON_ID=174948 /ORGANISM="Symbiodinium sp., Strain CCMP421" /LENGTH=102 /DNA_ID=CAMNT_0023589141 /DNA_START=77 /DNA_END=385 /DNA_ORIENTATION=-